MKFALCIVALTFMVSVEAVPAPLTPAIVSPTNGKEYFKKKLESIQGAIDDTIEAGKDLQDMEGALQRIVNLSSLFYLTESATEYAVDKKPYANGWLADNDDLAMQLANTDCANMGGSIEQCNDTYGPNDILGSTICPVACN